MMSNSSKSQNFAVSNSNQISELQIKTYEPPYLIRYSKTVKDKENVITAAIRCGGKCGQCSAHYWDK